MNIPTTRLSKLPLLLEPDQAEQLDALSKRLKMPKQVLLREAVSEMLAMKGYGTTELLQRTRSALELALPLAQKVINLTPGQKLWQGKAMGANHAIRTALSLFPDVKKGLL
jgi:predicted DNA-binding protein